MSKPVHVLLVEDDEDDYILTKGMLMDSPIRRFEIKWVADYDEAVQVIKSAKFDLYLIDYRLGRKDGLDLVRETIAAGCTAPIILLTGLDNRDIDVEAMEAGAADYLVKGQMSPLILERSIRYALARQNHLATERKSKEMLEKANKRLAELYEKAHQSVDNVSHEFRTPLTVVKEYSSILRDGLGGEINEKQREFLTIILDRVDDLTFLVDDMLDISKLEADLLCIYRRRTRLSDVIDRIRPILERKALANNGKLKIEIDDPEPFIYCDGEKIGRVLINLAVNAYKFSGEGGVVSIIAKVDRERSDLCVSVSDNGPGISPEQLQPIFDRFQQGDSQTRSATKGFGLGLNIAKELVELNYGNISVSSEVGNGSCFSFTVPIFDPLTVFERYTSGLLLSGNGSAAISLISVGLEPGADLAGVEEIEQILQVQLRRHDLLFETGPSKWVLCSAADNSGPDLVIEKISEAITQANSFLPEDELPPVSLNIIGTWKVPGDIAGLFARFNQIRAADAGNNSHNTHTEFVNTATSDLPIPSLQIELAGSENGPTPNIGGEIGR